MKSPIADIDLSHHACVLVGGASVREDLLSVLAKKHEVRAEGNPDFFDRRYESFVIGDARELKALAETRPANEGAPKVFVLLMNSITVEAQNALLKLLEEPPSYARFFFILPSAHLLLPTVKSRVQVLGAADTAGAESDIVREAKDFLRAPQAKRLEYIKKLMDDISKEKKTKQDAIDFLNALEEAVYSGTNAGGSAGRAAGLKKSRQALEAILLAGKYASDRAPSMKMLLEYVALNA